MQATILHARGIAKVYGGKQVLRGVDLQVERGRAIALIGHNGSGKSTLLKILAGLVKPTAGTIGRDGAPTFGYVPEHFPKGPLTAARYITHMGRIEGLSRAEAKARGDALFADFFMESLKDTPMRHLSKGSLQKVGVVQALLCPHDVLLLDEPLSGQDAASQEVFVRKVQKLRDEGTAVLISCHEAFLVNRLADAVYEIRGGQLCEVALSDGRFQERSVLTFAFDAAVQAMPVLPEGCTADARGGRLRVFVPVGEANALAMRLMSAGYILEEMRHENNL